MAKRFRFVSPGHSFRATEFEAALGLAQLEEHGKIIQARLRIARQLTQGLRDLQDVVQLPSQPPDRDHMYMLYPIVLLRTGKTALVNFLEDSGIETRDLMPLINQPVYVRLYGDLEARYPVARWLNRSGFYVGCHQYLSRRDVSYLIERLHAFFRR